MIAIYSGAWRGTEGAQRRHPSGSTSSAASSVAGADRAVLPRENPVRTRRP